MDLKVLTQEILDGRRDGEKAFQSGASATITGDMLTTVACATIKSDKQMLEALGRDVTPEYLK